MTPDQITAAQSLLWRAVEAGDLHQQRVAASAELWRQDLRALGIEPRQLVNELVKIDKSPAEDSSVSAALAAATACRTCPELRDKLAAAERVIESLRLRTATAPTEERGGHEEN